MKSFITTTCLLLIALTLNACGTGMNFNDQEQYRILVWADEDNIPQEAKLKYGEFKPPWYHHPCGVVQEVEVSRISPHDDANYVDGTERVIEFDEKGKLLGEWAMPVDSWVMAIEDDSIIVRYEEKAMSISNDGEISITEPVKSSRNSVKCPPDVKKNFGVSAYTRCFKLMDINTGLPRQLAYEGPCT